MSDPVKCPDCGAALSFETVAKLANESEIELTLKPAPGEMMGARTVGATIDNMEKMFRAIGKEMGAPTETLVRGIVTDADGTIRVTLVICRYDKAQRIRKRRAQGIAARSAETPSARPEGQEPDPTNGRDAPPSSDSSPVVRGAVTR